MAGCGVSRKCTLSKLRGDALCAFSFGGWSPGGGPGGPDLQPGHGGSTNLLSGSWVFYSGNAGNASSALLNPGKAVLTVDATTTQVLTANKAACALLGVMSTHVHSKKLCDFLVMNKGQYALTEGELGSAGEVVVIAGKVVSVFMSIA